MQLLSQSASSTITYRSDDCSPTSWIDHVICSTSILNSIAKINVTDNFSDHLPLTASVVLPGIQGETSFDANNPNSEVASFGQPLWTSASLDDIRSYQDFLWQSFVDTSFPVHLAQCSSSCNSSDHWKITYLT